MLYEVKNMSLDEKLDPGLMMGLIEDELEERKAKTDRRQKQCEESMKQSTDVERRVSTDRRDS